MEGYARQTAWLRYKLGNGDTEPLPIITQVERLTVTQLVEFFHCCRDKYMRSKIEPGDS